MNLVIEQKVNKLDTVLSRYHLTLDSEKDKNGNSLLIISTRLGDLEIVKLLLSYGANPNI